MIVAHRGDTSLGAAENSLEAFSASLLSGADMIELDVQWTKDHVFVCYHDGGIALNDGSVVPLYELTLEELRKEVPHDPAKGQQWPAVLSDVFELVRGKVYLNLEVKEYSDRDPKQFMQALEVLVREYGLETQVLFSSFRLDYIKSASWNIPTTVIQPDRLMLDFFRQRTPMPELFDEKVLQMLPSQLMRHTNATSYACMIEELTTECIEDIRKFNILLSVYTVHSIEEFDRALSLGAKAMVCEVPSEMVALRNRLFPADRSFPPHE